ncbi:SDR family oxidoreductase [Zooshikella harenae]|uniref:SDR family oxidoreductase n=1 Tax=Zooshikella harenae TaxID=2827238 RepID=A0ABS5ZJ48_9GAMM|nr:SDR family oxidoreductase [Zooshikella harenae]MBU2713022.1 SDR family oxidoreductase [Zooshikella harenae]
MPQKSILITGCSSGIGLHAAHTLKERGYRVFATARKQVDVDALIDKGLESIRLDLDEQHSIEQALEEILQRTSGTLDFLFNNGAYGQPGAIEDLPTEVLRQQFESNVFGWHHLTRKVLKVMRQQGHGRIVQNSSVLGIVCMPYRGAYNASKFAIEGLTDTLRLELKGSPIEISLIEPGPIISQFRANAAAKFKQNIDWQTSKHFESYKAQLDRLEKAEVTTPFTLGPEEVTAKLIHALESKNPKARYRVTFPTHLFALLKRLLTTHVLDRLLVKG